MYISRRWFECKEECPGISGWQIAQGSVSVVGKNALVLVGKYALALLTVLEKMSVVKKTQC